MIVDNIIAIVPDNIAKEAIVTGSAAEVAPTEVGSVATTVPNVIVADNELDITKVIISKIEDNKKHRDLLILLNSDPLKALDAIRVLYADSTLFSNYEIMLDNSERPIAIRNILNRITEQMKANNESIINTTNTDLSSIQATIKDRYSLNKISTITAGLESLYIKLEDADSLNLIKNMYNLDKIRIKFLANWFKLNAADIDNILDYNIANFIILTEIMTANYVEESLKMLEDGLTLDIEFYDCDEKIFYFKDADQSDVSPIENIKFLIETSVGLEPKVEITTGLLYNNLGKFKPSKNMLTTVIKMVDNSISDYNENKITSEAFKEVNRNYENIIITYFNIFALRLTTVSSYAEKVEEIVDNLNRVVSDIKYLQNSFK